MLDKREFVHYPWRVGRSVGRTIYAAMSEDMNAHVLIGVMDTPELALEAVHSHNDWISRSGRLESTSGT